MPANFIVNNRPLRHDQTQTRFTLHGTTSITGNYTNGTGIVPTFNNVTDLAGNPYNIPPTYTGVNGPGQGVPVAVAIQAVAGYVVNLTAGAYRIYSAAGTELASGTVPAAISAGPIPTSVTFLRG